MADTDQGYRIGPGDLLSITVFGEDDLSQNGVRVTTNGSISFPLLGEITVSGYTASELEEEIIKLLSRGFLKKPIVTISVLEYRLFYVNGEVSSPGGYNYVNDLTIQKAIALAGGLSGGANEEDIKIERESEPGVLYSVKYNTKVNPGDIITVEKRFIFYANGGVRKPGGYNYTDDLTVEKAITLAGGLTERASREKITLIREGEGELKRRVNFSDKISPGDIINVEESFVYYINGEIRSPGGYDYFDGLTVQKAITLAGGFTERASKQKIIIEHESEPGIANKVTLNTKVIPGDIISVGESFF